MDPDAVIAEKEKDLKEHQAYIEELRAYMFEQDDRIAKLQAAQPHTVAAASAAATGPPTDQRLDWTYEHIRTLIYWMNIANINIFLLDASAKYYKNVVMRVMAVTFLFSSLSTTVSLSQLGIDETVNPGAAAAVKYIFMVASAISTLLVGYIKLFKIQEMMDADVEMHKEWLDFATKISGELQMPVKLRKPALTLLHDMKAMYMGLFCKRPFISSSVKRYANQYFKSYNRGIYDDMKDCEVPSSEDYIKRTHIFCVFQDIMKNEIKRLATEIEVGNLRVNKDDQQYLADSAELLPSVQIDYAYDGPFITIRVTNPVQQQTTYGTNTYNMNNFSSPERALYLQKAIVEVVPVVQSPVVQPIVSSPPVMSVRSSHTPMPVAPPIVSSLVHRATDAAAPVTSLVQRPINTNAVTPAATPAGAPATASAAAPIPTLPRSILGAMLPSFSINDSVMIDIADDVHERATVTNIHINSNKELYYTVMYENGVYGYNIRESVVNRVAPRTEYVSDDDDDINSTDE